MTVWVFGDSFAANKNKNAWTNMLGRRVINHASNGSSEYRIWKSYQHAKANISSDDVVIFCHTSYSRVYLKNTVTDLLSRMLPSHPACDLILSDIQSKKENKFISILKTIWDDVYFYDNYQLIVNDLKRVPNSIHLNFFEDTIYRSVYLKNPGKINHMDEAGNQIIANYISKTL